MIPVRCVRCRRVRYHTPGPGRWVECPQQLHGEVAVICRECNESEKKPGAVTSPAA